MTSYPLAPDSLYLAPMKPQVPALAGKGAIDGVAAPEVANNASAQAGFIPMLSLIPPDAILAMMIGAMMIHGIAPGPQIIQKPPELF